MTKIQICTRAPRTGRCFANGCCSVLFLLLSACGGSSDVPESQPSTASVKASAPTSAPAETSNPLARMVKAVPARAGEQPVELRFELPTQPVVGAPFNVNLNVLGLADATALDVKVTAQSGVDVLAGPEASLGALKTGESVQHIVQLRAPAAGIFVIDVQLTAMVGGKSDTAVFALPVALPAPPDAVAATTDK